MRDADTSALVVSQSGFALRAITPNPGVTGATISYETYRAGQLQLQVLDLAGRPSRAPPTRDRTVRSTASRVRAAFRQKLSNP